MIAQALFDADIAAVCWCGYRAVRALIATPAADPQAELRSLLDRARYDLDRGWSEAAIDCIGRAQRLIHEETHHVD